MKTETSGVLRRSALILIRSRMHPTEGFRRDRYYAYDRRTKVLLGSSWRRGRLKQILREKGYRWPREW